jgi:hypothetical protein
MKRIALVGMVLVAVSGACFILGRQPPRPQAQPPSAGALVISSYQSDGSEFKRRMNAAIARASAGERLASSVRTVPGEGENAVPLYAVSVSPHR